MNLFVFYDIIDGQASITKHPFADPIVRLITTHMQISSYCSNTWTKEDFKHNLASLYYIRIGNKRKHHRHMQFFDGIHCNQSNIPSR